MTARAIPPVEMAGRRPRLAAAMGLLLALGACQPAPTAAPSVVGISPAPVATNTATTAPTNAPTAAPSVTLPPGATLPPGTSLADALRDGISTDDIVTDLARLGEIAAANGGNRATGSAGYDASAEFVAGELRAAGYEVELQPVRLATFRVDAPAVLEIVGGAAFADIRDVKPMLLSPSGDVTAPLFALNFDPAAEPSDQNGAGCDPSDWAGAPAGVIALVRPGPCRRRDVVVNAQAAGAVALIMAFPSWSPDHVLRPTLVDPTGLEIPALGVTNLAGIALFNAAEAEGQAHVAVHTTVEIETSMNVIAETAGGDPQHVIVIGGHLDSVVDGPGINDNGSGTMAILEMARELARLVPGGAPWKVRFAFWTGEETGLLGSLAYVGQLGPEGESSIEAYVNLDMIGSTNGIREVYEGDATGSPNGSNAIEALLGQGLTDQQATWALANIGGASDHTAFDQIGVPVSGIFSGASARVTASQAVLFGAIAGQPADPCYHLVCDTPANIDREWLEQNARAAAWALGRLASGEVVIPAG